MGKGKRREGRGRKAGLWDVGRAETFGNQGLESTSSGAEEGLAAGAAAALSIWQHMLDLVLHANPTASAKSRCPD